MHGHMNVKKRRISHFTEYSDLHGFSSWINSSMFRERRRRLFTVMYFSSFAYKLMPLVLFLAYRYCKKFAQKRGVLVVMEQMVTVPSKW